MKHYIKGRVVDSNIKDVEPGFVELVNAPGSDIEDIIVKSARVAHNNDTKVLSAQTNEKLIRYLWFNNHTSPFEHISFTFHVSCPMFIARQWFRHRTGKFNEISARYTKVEDHFWFPDNNSLRDQSTINHQSSGTELVNVSTEDWEKSITDTYKIYNKLLADGVAREQARAILPVNIMTRFYFTMDLHNLLHFLELRLAPDAQPEIRYYAEAIEKIITPFVSTTMGAFKDYTINSITFNAAEIRKLQELNISINFGLSDDMGGKEKKILEEKLKKLFKNYQ
jgi:thymidylate synthase (FAD)